MRPRGVGLGGKTGVAITENLLEQETKFKAVIDQNDNVKPVFPQHRAEFFFNGKDVTYDVRRYSV